jgi:hypothetical protein
MRLQAVSSLSDNADFERRLSATLLRIRSSLGLSDSTFLEMLGAKKNQKKYSVKNLESLCRAIDLNIDLLFSGQIDYSVLIKNYRTAALSLPERYSPPEQQLSRARSVYALFQHVQIFHGEDYAKSLLSRLQVHPEFLQDPSALISPLLAADAVEILLSEGFHSNQIFDMGTMTLGITRLTPLGRILQQKSSARELYQSVHEELVDQFDHVFDYSLLKITQNSCTVVIQPKERTFDLFRTLVFGNKGMCHFKRGVYASLLGNIRKHFAHIHEKECMYEGADRCIYELTWA